MNHRSPPGRAKRESNGASAGYIDDLIYDSATCGGARQKREQVINHPEVYKHMASSLSKRKITWRQKYIDNIISAQYQQLYDVLPRVIAVVNFDCLSHVMEGTLQLTLGRYPLAVVGNGVVCASNHEAYKYGVYSAMQVVYCRELCPRLCVVDTSDAKYYYVCRTIYAVFREYDANYKMLDISEAQLDITAMVYKAAMRGNTIRYNIRTNWLLEDGEMAGPLELAALEVVLGLRKRIQRELRVSVLIGVGITVQLARLCSEAQELGVQTITQLHFGGVRKLQHYVLKQLEDFPVGYLQGVDVATGKLLESALGVVTVGQLFAARGTVDLVLPQYISRHVLFAAVGPYPSPAATRSRSVCAKRIIRATANSRILGNTLMDLCKDVCLRLYNNIYSATHIYVRLTFSNCAGIGRGCALPYRTNTLTDIYRAATELMMVLLHDYNPAHRSHAVPHGFGIDSPDAVVVHAISIVCSSYDDGDCAALDTLGLRVATIPSITSTPWPHQDGTSASRGANSTPLETGIVSLDNSSSEGGDRKSDSEISVVDATLVTPTASRARTYAHVRASYKYGPIDAFLQCKRRTHGTV